VALFTLAIATSLDGPTAIAIDGAAMR